MNARIREEIQLLIDNSKAIAKDASATPHNYVEVLQCMLSLELQREVCEIEEMLKGFENFAERLLQRCRERSRDGRKCFTFGDLPESPANRLYWRIVELIFEPKTMHDMLALMVPDIKYQLTLQFTDTLSSGNAEYRKDQLRKYQPYCGPLTAMTRLPLTSLTDRPDQSALTNYVMVEDALFEVSQAAHLNLRHHADLEELLRTTHQTLHQKLYRHNQEFDELLQNINIHTRATQTPRQAIIILCNMLMLGSTAMTNREFATEIAHTGAKKFISYFRQLPIDVQNDLLQLSSNRISIAQIFRKLDRTDSCVHVISDDFKSILVKHPDPHPLLDRPSPVTPETLAVIQAKYAKNHCSAGRALATGKDSSVPHDLPIELASLVIGNIVANTIEDIITLLLNFPPDFYNTLFQHVQLKNPSLLLKRLAACIKSGMFHQAHVAVLAAAIANNYHRWISTKFSLLHWAISTDNLDVYREISSPKRMMSRQVVEGLFNPDEAGRNVLYLCDNPDLLQLILSTVPENLRDGMIAPLIGGFTPISPTHKPASIRTILSFVSNYNIFLPNLHKQSSRSLLEYVKTLLANFSHMFSNGYLTEEYERNFIFIIADECLSGPDKKIKTNILCFWLIEIDNARLFKHLADRSEIHKVRLRSILINYRDKHGNKIFHLLKNLASIQYVGNLLSSKSCRILWKTRNHQKHTSLTCNTAATLATKLSLIPPNKRTDALLQAVDPNSQPLIMLLEDEQIVTEEGLTLRLMQCMELLKYDEQLLIERTLSLAARLKYKPQTMQAYLSLFKPRVRLELLSGTATSPRQGVTIIGSLLTIRAAETFRAVMLGLPTEWRLQVLNCASRRTMTGVVTVRDQLHIDCCGKNEIPDEIFEIIALTLEDEDYITAVKSSKYFFTKISHEGGMSKLRKWDQSTRFNILLELANYRYDHDQLDRLDDYLSLLTADQGNRLLQKLLIYFTANTDNNDVKKVLSRLQPLLRVSALTKTLPFNTSEPVLESICQNTVSIQHVFKLLPADQRYSILFTTCSKNRLFIDILCGVENVDDRYMLLIYVLRYLSEAEKISLLKFSSHNRTVLDTIVEARFKAGLVNELLAVDEISESYENRLLLDIIGIFLFLHNEDIKAHKRTCNPFHFFYNSHARDEINLLKSFTSFEHFIEMALRSEYIINRDSLKERWAIKDPEPFNTKRKQ